MIRRKVPYLVFLPFICVLLCSNYVIAGDCFVAGPYVVHVGPNSAKIVWVSPPGTDAGQVSLKNDNEGTERILLSELTIPGFQKRPAAGPGSGALPGYERGGRPLNPEEKLNAEILSYERNIVYIENLQSHQRYHYIAECGDGNATREGSFLTAPEAGDNESSFDFIVTSDTHDNHDDVANAIGEQEADFVMVTGDLTGGHGHDWLRWLPFFESARPYFESSVFWPVVGGHDVQPALNFRAFFAFDEPDSDPVTEGSSGTWYSFTYGNVDFFVLDHIYDLQKQQKWLESELSESDADWKIVATHESMINVGSRGNLHKCVTRDHIIDHEKVGVEYCYEEMYEIYEKYGVDVVIFGHDHLYERNLPVGSEGRKPVHYISTRAGGSTREVRPSPIVAGGIGYSGVNYAHFQVEGNRLVMEAKKPDGTVIDRLELIKGDDGMYQEEIMAQTADLELIRTLGHIYTSESMAELHREVRRDIYGQLLSMPEPEEETSLLLYTGYSGTSEYDWSRFPIGSEFVIYAQDDPNGWQTEKQVITITGDSARVIVTAPKNFSVSDEGIDPPIELQVNIRVDGRKFEPARIRPTLPDLESLGKTGLIFPPELGTVSTTPEFQWEQNRYAQLYQFQITSTNFSQVLLDTTTNHTELILPFELEILAITALSGN